MVLEARRQSAGIWLTMHLAGALLYASWWKSFSRLGVQSIAKSPRSGPATALSWEVSLLVSGLFFVIITSGPRTRYDHCRGANLDWSDCHHHACSEVRAANLSGDCHWSQEFLRGNFSLQAQHQACVRRRALLSVAMNPNCPEPKAKEAVDAVFDTCFRDTRPFDRIP
mmetsp:Transcript_23495/g.56203  ORF Transcript_23495/g.56203 Transcript_23495/m.56203 type:complete len:168 (-) Transcript_23495:339-842(-)